MLVSGSHQTEHVVTSDCSAGSAMRTCIITKFLLEKWSSRAAVELWHVGVNRNAVAS